MKCSLFIFILVLASCTINNSYAQTDSINIVGNNGLLSDSGSSILVWANPKEIRRDTTPVILLISACENCYAKSVKGFMIGKCISCLIWVQPVYLDERKRKFKEGTIIWSAR